MLGSRIGVGGTLAGAAIASVITTVATAIYQHSMERSTQRVRALARRPGRLAAADETMPIHELPTQPIQVVRPATPPPSSHRRRNRRLALAGGGLGAFALAMIAVTGLEALRGEPLSGGKGTTVEQVIHPGFAPQDQQPSSPTATATTAPSARRGNTTAPSSSLLQQQPPSSSLPVPTTVSSPVARTSNPAPSPSPGP